MLIGSHKRAALWVMFILTGSLILNACAPAGNQNSTPVAAGGVLPTQSSGTATFLAPSPALDTTATSPAVKPTMPTGTVPNSQATAPQATTETAPTATAPAAAALTAAILQTGSPVGSVPSDSVTVFPDPGGYTWAPVISGLSKPLDLASPPDGSGRLFIAGQAGLIYILLDGNLLPEPFLDINPKVGTRGTEQGLLGIALHPDYVNNGYFYLNYTDTSGDTVIARYQVSANDPNQADPESEAVLLKVDQPYANHNGGSMVFGPDGFLYMGLGDGGSGGDPHGNGQSLDTLLGKILRVDVNGGELYAIPADNPFANGGGKPEIWSYGLRNPWRFSFDRLTGDVYIADVGQNQWEEVDFLPAGSSGANLGWNYREGMHPFQGSPPADRPLVDPVFEYQHGLGCSITGGYVYRGDALPEFRGVYLVSDFCTGRVWGVLRSADGTWQSQELFSTGLNVSSFGQDNQGEIYLMDQPTGTLYRLQQK